MTLIAVIDYGMGNRRSVEKALEHVGARVAVTRDHDQLRRADGLVLPGVGAFPVAMVNLNQLGLANLIREAASAGRPMLGICLGMQLLFDGSEELRPSAGLGLIAGQVRALHTGGLRLPHIGWNEVQFAQASPLTLELPSAGCPFYHVHSYAVHPRDPGHVLATSEYGEAFVTMVQSGSVYGVQFHPEKSSAHGLRLLGNFVRLCAQMATHAVAA